MYDWDVYGMCMGCIWDVHGMYMGCDHSSNIKGYGVGGGRGEAGRGPAHLTL
jgi:hypothetical protein